MYEVTAWIAPLMIFHIATIYICGYVLNLEYKTFLAVTTPVGAAAAILLKGYLATHPTLLKDELGKEIHAGEFPRDIGIAVVIFILGAIITNILLYKRFGLSGWLGVFGANALVNAII